MLPLNPLGPRLQCLFDLVKEVQQEDQQRYDCIWDCCCDHGYLGMKILNESLCQTLYFVDQVPHIIQRLRAPLEPFPPERYELVTSDASSLHFNPNQKHLVILAGVGGEHIIDIIDAIGVNHPHGQIDFLFCPTTTQYNLREYLAKQKFALAHESIATEKQREYEIIHVRGKTTGDDRQNVSRTGAMWNGSSPQHRRYLNKLMDHYRNRTRGAQAERAHNILRDYQQCLDHISASPSTPNM